MPPNPHPCAVQENETIPNHEGSFGRSVLEQGSSSTSLQVPDASAQHGLQGDSSMLLKSNATGLALEDVAVDMPGQMLRFVIILVFLKHVLMIITSLMISHYQSYCLSRRAYKSEE